MRSYIEKTIDSLQEGDYVIYTDGSADNRVSPKVACVGGVILNHKYQYVDEFSKYVGDIATGGAEIASMLKGVEILQDYYDLQPHATVVLVNDSTYAVNSCYRWLNKFHSEGYKKWCDKENKIVVRPNADLLKQVYHLKQDYDLKFYWEKSRTKNTSEFLYQAHSLAYECRCAKVKELENND